MPTWLPGHAGDLEGGMPAPVSATSISISGRRARLRASACGSASRVASAGAGADQRVEHALLGGELRPWRATSLRLALAHQPDARLDQVADDLLDVAADIADLGELGRLDLDERRAGELGQAARDLGLADAGRADHQDVLGQHLLAQLVGRAAGGASGCAARSRRRAWRRCWPTMCWSSSETISRGRMQVIAQVFDSRAFSMTTLSLV